QAVQRHVHLAQERVLRLFEQQARELGLHEVRNALRSPACHGALPWRSVVEELDALGPELGELEPVDETHDFLQTPLDVRLLGPHLRYAERGAPPEAPAPALRARRAARGLRPRLERAAHATLPLSRTVLLRP